MIFNLFPRRSNLLRQSMVMKALRSIRVILLSSSSRNSKDGRSTNVCMFTDSRLLNDRYSASKLAWIPP